MDLISVIIPIYNVCEYLSECITSVLSQTFKNLEIILVDDGSDDGSEILCDKWALKDPRIKVIHQENKGPSAARNAGTAIAQGNYITYVDSDDILKKDMLSRLLKAVKKENVGIAVCHFFTFTDKPLGKELSYYISHSASPQVLTGREAALEIVHFHKRFMITPWGKLYDRSLIPLLSYPEGRIHEDEFVTYKVFYKTEKTAVLRYAGYGYRIRPKSIMQGPYTIKRLDALNGLSSSVTWFDNENDAEMAAFARLRYLLNLEIAWYRVYTAMNDNPDQNKIEHDLIDRHNDLYEQYRRELMKIASTTEKAAISIFNMNPRLYCRFAALYYRFGDDLKPPRKQRHKKHF